MNDEGGNGRVVAKEDSVWLDEKAWWSLERNLSFLQIRAGLKNKKTFSLESTDPSDRFEYESVASDESDTGGLDTADAIRRDAILNRKRKNRHDDTKLSMQRRLWLIFTYMFSWWVSNRRKAYLLFMQELKCNWM